MMTVIEMLKDHIVRLGFTYVITLRIKVRSRYLATRGIDDEVAGRILDTSSRNTTIESKTFMVNPIFSPVKLVKLKG